MIITTKNAVRMIVVKKLKDKVKKMNVFKL